MKFKAHLKPIILEAESEQDVWEKLVEVLGWAQVECDFVEEVKT